MPEKPLTAASLRGAVDLSALAKPAASARSTGAAKPGGSVPAAGLVQEVDDQSFGAAVEMSLDVPVILAVYSGARPASQQHVDELAGIVGEYGGRLVLATADIDTAMQIRQALQVQQVPMVLALIKGQPLPLYMGPQPADAVRGVFDQVLQAAQQAGVTGTVPVDGEPASAQEPEPEEDPLLTQAYDAIEAGDYDAAIAAYDQLLATNPGDEGARLGRGQVLLLQRTADLDATAVREAAAQNPTDFTAQTQVADLDLLGGHVEDAFARLIDLVKATSGDEKTAAREHLIGLFDIIGPTDERVKKARTALMSALY
ncbi:tetratricopeptide repeat protein [Branchiibius sp. NY16-3462-2]|uniref:co-chaperone YbbN n=1 Tax=Branchiibius sp. NY16-3462-2 TaxID=1807500 RepID=UPI0007969B99|nr:tetratricopeptide repeat protein [Branchiibius sp. NY16-3462-2]KYH45798.1 hypothetical protein AZH51_08900 [Branchiibius sp. NY16-3462-2]